MTRKRYNTRTTAVDACKVKFVIYKLVGTRQAPEKLLLEDGTEHVLTMDQTRYVAPQVGDYVVWFASGRTRVYSKTVFEHRFEPEEHDVILAYAVALTHAMAASDHKAAYLAWQALPDYARFRIIALAGKP